MTAGRVRPLALAIIRRGDRILVGESYDRVKGERFYRPVGGEIDFGERSAEALARELREELGVTVARADLLGILENVFVFEDEPGHEIVLVYEVELAEPLPDGRIPIADEGGDAVWMPVADFEAGLRLYPEGLYALLTT